VKLALHFYMAKNRFGLSRDIPWPVSRAVRHRCGYGCVICGRAVIQYHHFDPPFCDAEEHRAEGITLLCGSCHDKEKRGLIGPRTVDTANDRPVARQRGFAHEDLLFSQSDPRVSMGGTQFYCRYPILIDRRVILGFDPPEELGAPLRLSARLFDGDGKLALEIVRNELRLLGDSSDVEIKADRIELKRAGKLAVRLRHNSDHGLSIDYLDMLLEGHRFEVREGSVSVTASTGAKLQMAAGSVHAEAGYKLKASGLSFCGSAPFFDEDIVRFNPSNPLEKSLTAAKDDGPSRNAFWELLSGSQAFIALGKEQSNAGREVLIFKASEGTEDLIAVGTARNRLRQAIDRSGDHFDTVGVAVADMMRAIGAGRGILINPFEDLSLRIPATQCARLFMGG
jgi:hypothetical protein